MPDSTSRSVQRVMAPLGIGTALSLLGDNTLYTVLPQPEIAAQAGVTLAMVGVLLGANRAVRLVFNGAAGVLCDRIPRRRLLLGAMTIGLLSTTLLAVGEGFPILLLARVLWGMAWSGLWIGGNAMVLDLSQAHNRGRLSGQYQMWFFVGVGMSGFLGGLFTDLLGFRPGLLLSTGLTALALLLWVFLLPETRTPHVIIATRARIDDTPFPWRAIAHASIAVFVTRFVFAGVLTSTTILWLREFFGNQVVLPFGTLPIATFTGLFVAGRAFSSLVGAPLIGALSDGIGRRWGVLTGVLLAGAVGTWVMGSDTMALALSGALLGALAASGAQGLAGAVAGDEALPAQRGRAVSVIYTLGDLGSALAPALTLGLVGVVSISIIYRAAALLLALAALLALWRARGEGADRAYRSAI